MLQLAAHGLLVEECCHRRPAYGIIKYSDRAFEVDYTLALDNRLVATLNCVWDDLAAGDALRSHHSPVAAGPAATANSVTSD